MYEEVSNLSSEILLMMHLHLLYSLLRCTESQLNKKAEQPIIGPQNPSTETYR